MVFKLEAYQENIHFQEGEGAGAPLKVRDLPQPEQERGVGSRSVQVWRLCTHSEEEWSS